MIGMRRPNLLAVGMFVLALSVLAGAQTKYSVGTIEKVHKVAPQPTHTADAQLAAEVDTFEISVRVGSVLYVVEYDSWGREGDDLQGLVGRKYEVAVQGKIMLVKTVNGRNLRLPILRREPGRSAK